ncbi:MAG: DUF983 domain-containing protein [Caulobacterales bacterium]|nr:DUF983 domain-containing protein [Caulobacterales bacterium]
MSSSPAKPFLAGLAGRCPNCGQGRLFAGFLRIRPVCDACAFPLAKADSGDGPAVFIILIVGFLMAFGSLFVEVAYHPPVWIHLVVFLPLTVLLCLALLRPMKGLLVAAQFHNQASEAGRGDV